MKLSQKFIKLNIKIAISQSGITPLLRSFLRLRTLLRSRWRDPPATALRTMSYPDIILVGL